MVISANICSVSVLTERSLEGSPLCTNSGSNVREYAGGGASLHRDTNLPQIASECQQRDGNDNKDMQMTASTTTNRDKTSKMQMRYSHK